MKATIHSNGGMLTFCETYLCNKPADYFIGPKDGPLKLKMNLCGDCRESILEEFIIEDMDYVSEKVKAMKERVMIEKAKEKYGGKEYFCKKCDQVFYSPSMLATHAKDAHRSEEVEEKSSV